MLVKKFLEIMKANKIKLHGLDDQHLPDKKWLIDVISTLDPTDEIFKKDYVPPPRKNLIEEQKSIQVPEDFLKGLPESKSKVKRRALKVIGEGMAKQRISYMKQQLKDLNVAILMQEMRVDAFKEKESKSKAAEKEKAASQNFKSPTRPSSNNSSSGTKQRGSSSLNNSASQPQATGGQMSH